MTGDTEPVQVVVTATRREADAVLRDLGPTRPGPSTRYETHCAAGILLVVSGIGLAEAAAATAHVVATRPVSAVFSLGVAGGFDVPLRGVAVGRTILRADTGIEDATGRIRTTREAIGIGDSGCALGHDRVARIAARLPGAVLAHVLSVATVTGTARRAAQVLARRPDDGPAVEDMEAWGVLIATRPYDLPCFAVKTISNALGPRDRSAWELDGALDTLSTSAAALFREPPDWT